MIANSNIKIEVVVNKPLEKVWKFWTEPEHITRWNFATDEWECPKAENDLTVGGKFSYIMAARDSSARFAFEGIYIKINHFNYAGNLTPMSLGMHCAIHARSES